MSLKVRRIVDVETYEKTDGTGQGKIYNNVGILKEITMENGGHFFTVKWNSCPGHEFKVYDMEPKDKKNEGKSGQAAQSPPPQTEQTQTEEKDLPF